MPTSVDVIVVGAGVQGASVAYQLARRGAKVLVLERGAIASGATGRSSGFVRMHYDLLAEARLAWASYPTYRDWASVIGHGDCGFVKTGFLQLSTPELADALRGNVALQQGIGIPTSVVTGTEVAAILGGGHGEDVVAAAYEPVSGYADPTGTAAGFLAAARALGAVVRPMTPVARVVVDGDRVAGVETAEGVVPAGVVIDAAGAWAGELAATVGLEVPIVPWRHDTSYFGLPAGRGPDFPVVIDDINLMYFRPEGHELMLVGLETDSEIGGSPDRPMPATPPEIVEKAAERVCRRMPIMAGGTFRTGHGGQDGISPDQRPILDQAGPDGFYLICGLSGTGFKTAPAIGEAMAEWVLEGAPRFVDIAPFHLRRFAEERPLVGEHPYDRIWR